MFLELKMQLTQRISKCDSRDVEIIQKKTQRNNKMGNMKDKTSNMNNRV